MPKKRGQNHNHNNGQKQNESESKPLSNYLMIHADNFSNFGLIKVEFIVEYPLKNDIQNFFYSIYGNTGYTLKGAFDIRQLNTNNAPCLLFKTNDNTIFFIKIKTIINNVEIENCKFIDLTQLKNKENINMNILDKSTEELFKSINLEETESEYTSGGDENASSEDNSIDNELCELNLDEEHTVN
tara:strand:+ start:556 stop:1110 length:555 start_codon:yes stop_codon:yes gene_type:complete